jgi:hypothetical protein
MQGMLDNLSQPVAFATIPLSQEPVQSSSTPIDQHTPDTRRDSGNASSDTDLEEPILSKFSRKIGLRSKVGDRSRRMQKATSPVASQGPRSSNKNDLDFDGEEDDDFLDAGQSAY